MSCQVISSDKQFKNSANMKHKDVPKWNCMESLEEFLTT